MKQLIRNLIQIALLLAAVSAFAQDSGATRVKVPFPFVAMGKNWPAGDYKLQLSAEHRSLILNSPSGRIAAVLTTPQEYVDGSYLRFHRSGERWVLQEVALGGKLQSLLSGKNDRALAKRPFCQGALVAGCLVEE
jgi:hypothetical protein